MAKLHFLSKLCGPAEEASESNIFFDPKKVIFLRVHAAPQLLEKFHNFVLDKLRSCMSFSNRRVTDSPSVFLFGFDIPFSTISRCCEVVFLESRPRASERVRGKEEEHDM